MCNWLTHDTAHRTALASQSLSIMIALIPYVRETFRRHLSMKQAVMLVEFDKLKRVRVPHYHPTAIPTTTPLPFPTIIPHNHS